MNVAGKWRERQKRGNVRGKVGRMVEKQIAVAEEQERGRKRVDEETNQ